MKKHSADTIKALIELRKRGRSIPEISTQLHLSKSTVHHYTKDVIVLPQYTERLLQRRKTSTLTSQHHWRQATTRAQAIGNTLSHRDIKLIAACLYWAEGAKADFSLSNTDPDLIKIFLYTLRKGFRVKDSEIKISLRVYEDLDIAKCLQFWSAITGIPLNQNTSVNILHGSKKGKLAHGMCRIRVRKAGLLLKEMASTRKHFMKIIGPRSSMNRTRDS